MNEIEILLNVDMFTKWSVSNTGYYMCSMCTLIAAFSFLLECTKGIGNLFFFYSHSKNLPSKYSLKASTFRMAFLML